MEENETGRASDTYVRTGDSFYLGHPNVLCIPQDSYQLPSKQLFIVLNR